MLIAQISDIHATPDNDNLSRFDLALTWLEQLRPDGVVLTGDLTDNHWLEGYKQLAERLQQQNYPSWVLPGNSDNRYLMRAVWGEKTWALDAPDGALHFVHNAGSLQLIGLDSTVAGQDYGSVAGHLEWLNASSAGPMRPLRCCSCIILLLPLASRRWMQPGAGVWIS